MRAKINRGLLAGCVLSVLAQAAAVADDSHLAIVPRPVSVNAHGGTYRLPAVLSVSSAPVDWQPHVAVLADAVERLTAGRHQVRLVKADPASLVLEQDESLAAEAYRLTVTDKGIRIAASSQKGLAHGTATLLQLMGTHGGTLPTLTVEDAPQAAYRNFMIDMGRNPHSVALLKETIDLLWFYRIDSVHLHLTDDQRFAFPSTAFPKLSDGLISVDEFRELEAYAVARGVTIIPELEVPGHSGILRSKYPEVFGKGPADLATSETALRGIKTLLDEMMDVFASSPYIHIGGDEAFGVPEEPQRDLINKLHAYLKSKGRQTMVWEGPRPGRGENKVHEDVIHVNWRTINYPADQMLKDGYRVVNAAWDPLYIVDHYPRINFTMTSPQHIYETLKLTRFKHVNPGIRTYAQPVDVEQTERLIGFCMPWWEGREANFFAQNVPRLIPFAEIAWNPDVQRDYDEFAARTSATEATRRAAFYPVTIKASDLVVPADGVFHNQTTVTLSSVRDPAEIRYTLDGSLPSASSSVYQQPLTLTKSATVRAALFVDGQPVGHGSRLNLTGVEPVENLALGRPVTSSRSSGPPFSVQRVTDGGTHFLDFYLGYPADPDPVLITIDLEQPQQINRVVVHAFAVSNSFEKYSVEVSTDGRSFEPVASRQERPEKEQRVMEHSFSPRQARYVRIRSLGNKGYVFDSFSKIVEVQVFGP
ncbi:MAG: family 20 glycosylhydrolase [Planctomycetaceae bacterium]|nr:family 20 glycosylhydrolase [Planctomycetaceae bacterium]